MTDFPIQIPSDANATERLLLEAAFLLFGAILAEKTLGFTQGALMGVAVDLAGQKIASAYGEQPVDNSDIIQWTTQALRDASQHD